MPLPPPAAELISRAAEMINEAVAADPLPRRRRRAFGAAAAAVALAEKASLPTVMTLMALGAMPVDHRCPSACSACTARVAPIWRSTSAIC
jgi:acetolactate synthase-1/2/3 large subunit